MPWAIKHSLTNRLDGHREWFEGRSGDPLADGLREPHPGLSGYRALAFETRAEAREWVREKWAYLRDRPDLRAEPFCWRMPKPVRVAVQILET